MSNDLQEPPVPGLWVRPFVTDVPWVAGYTPPRPDPAVVDIFRSGGQTYETPPAPRISVAAPTQTHSQSIEDWLKEGDIGGWLKREADKAVSQALEKAEEGENPPVPDPADFTRADARSRALNTFFTGMTLSALYGAATAVGTLEGATWSDKSTWLSVVTLAVGSGVTAAFNYVTRIFKEPMHQATLCEHTPGGPPFPRGHSCEG